MVLQYHRKNDKWYNGHNRTMYTIRIDPILYRGIRYCVKKRRVIPFYLAAFFVPFTIYTLTLAPSVTFGDSGELITAAYVLGIPHPPGSPLWLILTKLFMLIPLGSIAWRANLASAFFSASTCLVIFHILRHTSYPFVGKLHSVSTNCIILITVFSFSVSKTVWGLSEIAEVYTLMNLLFSLLILTLLSWQKTKQERRLYCISFLLALGVTNHYLFLLLIPPVGIWLLYDDWRRIVHVRILSLMLFFFCIGLSMFLYIPIRARANPAINWRNPATLSRFIQYIRREQFNKETNAGIYLPIEPMQSMESVRERAFASILYLWQKLAYEIPPYILIVSCTGILAVLFQKRKDTRSWLILHGLCFFFIGYIYVLLTYTGSPIRNVYYAENIMPMAITHIFLGWGLMWIAGVLTRFHRIIPAFFIAAICTIPMVGLFSNYRINNWSRNWVAYTHGMNVLSTSDANAVIFVRRNRWVFPLLYLKIVERKRLDITIYDRDGNLFDPVYTRNPFIVRTKADFERHRQGIEKEIIAANPERPFYYATDKDFENYPKSVTLEGILYKGNAFPARNIDFSLLYSAILSIKDVPWIDGDTAYIVYYYHLRFAEMLFREGKQNQALEELTTAYQFGKTNEMAILDLAMTYNAFHKPDESISMYKKAIEINPDSYTYYTLGTIYEQKDELKQAIEAYEQGLMKDPGNTYAIILLAQLYEKDTNISKAREQYRKVLHVEPNNQEAKKNFERLAK